MKVLMGLFLIIFGLGTIYYNYKNPTKWLPANNFRGYVAGIGLIIIGFLLILKKDFNPFS